MPHAGGESERLRKQTCKNHRKNPCKVTGTDGVKSAECPTNVKEVVARFAARTREAFTETGAKSGRLIPGRVIIGTRRVSGRSRSKTYGKDDTLR